MSGAASEPGLIGRYYNKLSYSAINVFEETNFSGAEPFFKVQESFALRNCVPVSIVSRG